MNSVFDVFAPAIEAALSRVSVTRLGVNPRPVGLVEKLAVFAMQSPVGVGYITLGMERGLFREGEFLLPAVEMALRQEFDARELNVQLEQGFWINLPETDFEPWVVGAAELTLMAAHEFSRLVIGVFKLGRPAFEVKLHSEAQQMFTFRLDDLSTDYPIPFSAYVHLPLNDKYFLYLRQGRSLSAAQKQRLRERQTDQICVKKDDVRSARTFFAESYFRSLIKAEG